MAMTADLLMQGHDCRPADAGAWLQTCWCTGRSADLLMQRHLCRPA